MPRRFLLAAGVVSLLLVGPAAAGAAAAMYWGGTIKGSVYGLGGEAPTAPAVVARFEHDAGKKLTFVNTGQSWASWDAATMQAAIDDGALPLVTMGLPAGVTLQEVAEGAQDAQIRQWAQKAAAWGYPFLFRPWREMNGDWYSWGRDPEYVRAWRHFHDVVEEEGASNVTWAWIVNSIWWDPESDPTPYYPGDEYVDWVGMDAYNWGLNPLQPDRWLTPEQAIGPTLDVLEAVAPGKPVALTEVASTEIGGNKASWVRDFLGSYLPHHPEIKAMLWFNWNIQDGTGRWDWPIESSVPAEQAFRDGIQSSGYLAQLPPLTPLEKVPMPSWPGPAAELEGGPGPTQAGDGIWARAVQLGAGGGEDRDAQLAAGPDGGTIAVWDHHDGSDFVIQERRLGPGGAPAGPVRQLSASGGDAFEPRLAVAPDGSAIVVWKRFDGSAYVIQERRLDAAGEPEAAAHDLSAAGRYAGQARVAVGSDGRAVVVWERYDGYRTRIQTRAISAAGVPASIYYDLSGGAQNSVEPDVAIGPDGRAWVVWDRYDGSDSIVQGRRLAAGGAPEATTYDLSAAGSDAIEPDLAAGGDGAATVVWTRPDGTTDEVQALRLGASGAPKGAAAALSDGSGPALQPRVAAAADGSAAVVWEQRAGAGFVVEERHLETGGVAAATTYDLSGVGADAHEPRVASGPDGTATVAWDTVSAGGAVVQAQRLRPGGEPDGPVVELSATGAGVGEPAAAAADGSAAVAWRRFDGVRDHLEIALFGPPAAAAPGTPPTDPGPTPPGAEAPGNEFRIGRVKLDRRRGTARLGVWLPGPGRLWSRGREVAISSLPGPNAERRRGVATPVRGGVVFLRLAAVGRKRRVLLARGWVRVAPRVSYLPAGGSRRSRSRPLTLRLNAQPRSRGGR